MKKSPQTIYQELQSWFPALTRSNRVVQQDTDRLSIWLRESADQSTLDAFCVEFARPPVQPPLAVFDAIQRWLPQDFPAIAATVDELTQSGSAAPWTHNRKQAAGWSITVSVFHKSIAIRFDHVAMHCL